MQYEYDNVADIARRAVHLGRYPTLVKLRSYLSNESCLKTLFSPLLFINFTIFLFFFHITFYFLIILSYF